MHGNDRQDAGGKEEGFSAFLMFGDGHKEAFRLFEALDGRIQRLPIAGVL
ncbi:MULTISPECIES: hypothetical protein [Stenotrophomonas]|nr:hypothetical protein [Stenotrophomonas rhizophila]